MSKSLSIRDRHQKFVADALLVRAEFGYRATWQDANDHVGADLSGDPEPNGFEPLSERYAKLLDEWACETPDTAVAVVDYLELVSTMIAGQLAHLYTERAASPIGTERELGYALELLASASRWVNNLALQNLTVEVAARVQSKGDTTLPAPDQKHELECALTDIHGVARNLVELSSRQGEIGADAISYLAIALVKHERAAQDAFEHLFYPGQAA